MVEFHDAPDKAIEADEAKEACSSERRISVVAQNTFKKQESHFILRDKCVMNKFVPYFFIAQK